MTDDYSDLVPWSQRQHQFEARAWLVIGRGYQALATEVDVTIGAGHAKRPKTIVVSVVGQGRAATRTKHYYDSLSTAMRDWGRRVRTSLDRGRPSGGIRAQWIERDEHGQ